MDRNALFEMLITELRSASTYNDKGAIWRADHPEQIAAFREESEQKIRALAERIGPDALGATLSQAIESGAAVWDDKGTYVSLGILQAAKHRSRAIDLALAHFDFESLRLDLVSARDAGTHVLIEFRFAGDVDRALFALLDELPFQVELSIPDSGIGDCSREVKRTADGFQLKRGCHGSYGTWPPGNGYEALEWLTQAGRPSAVCTLSVPA